MNDLQLRLGLNNDNFLLYDASNPEDVQQKYLEHQSSWSINLFSWKQKTMKLNPFNQSCVGIDTKESYKVHLSVISMFIMVLLMQIISYYIYRNRLLESFVIINWNYTILISRKIKQKYLILLFNRHFIWNVGIIFNFNLFNKQIIS